MRFLRLLPVALLLAVVLVAAGCGGGGGQKDVPANAVAVVGDTPITKAQFNFLIAGAKNQADAAKAAFPKPGTADYKTLQDKALAYLVQESELEQKGKDIGVQVSDADVDKQIAQIKQQYFGGDEKKFEQQLKAQGFTLPLLKIYQRGNLLSNKLYKKVTSTVNVTDADIQKYYSDNKAQYQTPASRDVRHILVSSKKQADDLEHQLKSGGSFAALAKKYSKDTLSAVKGGKLTIEKGKTVPEFDKEAFSLKTNEISPPVHTQYGWHIIQALSAVKAAKTQPLKDVKPQIRQNLLQTKKTDAFQKWLDGVKKDFEKSVSYAAGYVPSATTSTSTATQTTTTG
ncbi:MAG TPA: peptidylprolyl isomerase [Gaiellaceae bacterium]|jgi:foldase protein PrsA|nr:peptidylprolyl isomerase [Gaiellaceae bacterium]